MENPNNVIGWRKTATMGLGGLAMLVGAGNLTGCQPEYQSRITQIASTQPANIELQARTKEALAFYKSINPNKLTDEQKQKLNEFLNSGVFYCTSTSDGKFEWGFLRFKTLKDLEQTIHFYETTVGLTDNAKKDLENLRKLLPYQRAIEISPWVYRNAKVGDGKVVDARGAIYIANQVKSK